MDIRALIDIDENASPRKHSGSSLFRQTGQTSTHAPLKTSNSQWDGLLPSHDARHSLYPSELPGYQHPHAGPANGASSTHQHAPYQNREITRHESSLQPARSPSYPHQRPPRLQQDNLLSIGDPTNPLPNPSTPLTPTPTGSTPGSANGYANRRRPTSSHSTSTPTSAHPATQYLPRESPQAQIHGGRNGPHVSGLPASPQVSPHSGTPLGPPASLPRANPDAQNMSPQSQSHKRTISGELRSDVSMNASHSLRSVSSSQNGQSPVNGYESNPNERSKSVSISPKTQPSGLPRLEHWKTAERSPSVSYEQGASHPSADHATESGFTIPKVTQSSIRRTSSMGIDSMLNAAAPGDLPKKRLKRSPPNDTHMYDVTRVGASNAHGNSRSYKDQDVSSNSPPLTDSNTAQTQAESKRLISYTSINAKESEGTPTISQDDPNQASFRPTQNKKSLAGPTSSPEMASSTAQTAEPAHKKIRLTAQSAPEVGTKGARNAKPPRLPKPIWAQSVRDNSTNAIKGSASHYRRSEFVGNNNGNASNRPASHYSQPPDQKIEPSIINTIPTNQIVKVVSDWLYLTVMENQHYKSAVLEIEAKLGRVIDKHTMERLQVPILTEAVLNRNNPSLRTQFESSMTETQHRALNNFLNNALVDTRKSSSSGQSNGTHPKQRVPMHYKHTKEVDTFYEFSKEGLLNLTTTLGLVSQPMHKPKVRITHEQESGKELARIVKIRLNDLDICSPQNEADFRISVNIEMDFKGDMRDLAPRDNHTAKQLDRQKDRMSYRHQAYQIDLTQVTPTETTSAMQKVHELEIEVSYEELLRQATLLKDGNPNHYMELVSAFVDNMRLLARQVPHDNGPLIFPSR